MTSLRNGNAQYRQSTSGDCGASAATSVALAPSGLRRAHVGAIERATERHPTNSEDPRRRAGLSDRGSGEGAVSFALRLPCPTALAEISDSCQPGWLAIVLPVPGSSTHPLTILGWESW